MRVWVIQRRSYQLQTYRRVRRRRRPEDDVVLATDRSFVRGSRCLVVRSGRSGFCSSVPWLLVLRFRCPFWSLVMTIGTLMNSTPKPARLFGIRTWETLEKHMLPHLFNCDKTPD